MVVAILMESDMKLSDDLIEAIIDKVSFLKFNSLILLVVKFSRAFDAYRVIFSADIC